MLKHLLLLVMVFAMTTISAQANAQPVPGDPALSRLERFDMPLDDNAIVNVEGAKVGTLGTWGLNFWVGHSNDPLMIENRRLVNDQLSASLGGYIVPAPSLALGVDVPVTLLQGRYDKTLPKIASAGLNDLRIRAKYQILRQSIHQSNLALGVDLRFPTSRGDTFADGYFGETDMTFSPYLAASRKINRNFRYAVNLGLRFRPEKKIGTHTVGEEGFFRIGIAQRYGAQEFGASLNGAKLLRSNDSTYGELMGSYTYRRKDGWFAFVGTGMSISDGYGAPDWRLFAGLRFTHRPRVQRKLPPPVKPAPPVTKLPPAICCPKIPPRTRPLLIVPTSYFAYNNRWLPNKYKAKIADLGKRLQLVFEHNPGIKLILIAEGHTDSIGTKQYNMQLGTDRALAVLDALKLGGGFSSKNLRVVSKGENYPIASNKTAKGRAANRRVVIYLVGALDEIDVETLIMLPELDTYDSLGNR